MKNSSSIYTRSPEDGVWQRPDHGTFGYSDGDEVENRIAAIMRNANDRSVLSAELRASIQDWPTRYHLSSLRANVLRPVEWALRGSVLEIGSGCGAITRYLGETARSVLALEGSRRRAHITRLRTRELSNVEVYCDEFSAFQTEQRFDAVTLIGVLEYAHMFIRGEQAAHHMLQQARERLNEDGSLVIAIENQLGLKYFGGAPEDHLGKPMIGVEDNYLPQGVRTYGRKALAHLLQSAGFSSVEFLYPFPDYKLPVSILTEQALSDSRFDPTPFLVLNAGKDPQISDAMAFGLERAWPVMAANGLVADHANSFLVVARKAERDQEVREPRVLAWHFSTQRRPEYCKETLFFAENSDTAVQIKRRSLGTHEPDPSTESQMRHVLVDQTPYAPLPLLSADLIDLVTRPGWTDRQLGEFLRRYAGLVGQVGSVELIRGDEILWDVAISGDLFDCIPQNIRLHPDGSCSVFDLEWRQAAPITFLSLAFRSLWHTIGNLSLIGVSEHGQNLSMLELIVRALRVAGFELSPARAQELVRAELELQERLTGERFDFDAIWSWMSLGSLRQWSVFQRLHVGEQQKKEWIHQLKEAELAVHHWRQHAEGLVEEVKHRDVSLADWQAHARNLTESVGNLQSALNRQQKEKDEALDRLHQEQTLATEARADNLDGLRALHRLSQQAAHQRLRRSSIRGLFQVARDHRSVVLRNLQGAAASGPSVTWAPRLTGYLNARSHVTVLALASDAEQLGRWIRQSCQWQFPFRWHLIGQDEASLHSVSTMAAHLGIEAAVASGQALACPAVMAWLQSLPSDALVALPRIVGAPESVGNTSSRLPNEEELRQGYSAMTCDRGIAGTYVGLSPAFNRDASGEESMAFLSLFRASFLRRLPVDLSVWSPSINLSLLHFEIDALRKQVVGVDVHGRVLLV